MFKKLITIQFSVHWLRWLIYSAFLLIVLYIVFPKWHDPLVYAAAVLGGVGVLISAMNDIETRIQEVEEQKASLSHERSKAAMTMVRHWISPKFFHAKFNCRKLLEEFRTTGPLDAKKISENDEHLQNLMDVLNFFESASLAIQNDIADEAILRKFFRSMLLEYWHLAKAWIDARRAGRNNPRLLLEMEWLYERWKS